MNNYQEVNGADGMAVGAQGRVTMTLRAPYTTENVEQVEAQFRKRAAVQHLTVDSVRVTYPNKDTGNWTAVAYFTVAKSAPSRGVVVDAIAGLCQDVVGFVINSVALIFTKVEELVAKTVDDVVTKPLSQVLNPGVLILVVVGLALVFGRR